MNDRKMIGNKISILSPRLLRDRLLRRRVGTKRPDGRPQRGLMCVARLCRFRSEDEKEPRSRPAVDDISPDIRPQRGRTSLIIRIGIPVTVRPPWGRGHILESIIKGVSK